MYFVSNNKLSMLRKYTSPFGEIFRLRSAKSVRGSLPTSSHRQAIFRLLSLPVESLPSEDSTASGHYS